MVVRVSDKKQTYNNVTKLLVKPIFKCANSRLGWYRRSAGYIVNFLLSPTVLGIKKGDRPGLVNPLIYYLETL